MSVELVGVSKSAGEEQHLYRTDLALRRGLSVVIGPTSAGKTTLLRLIAGLERPLTGQILFDGQDVTGVPVQRRNVAMVYQQFINYPSFTVYDNIASPLTIAGHAKAEIDRRVRQVAELLHIETYLTRHPHELSGGQQQRTAIARALVKDSRILLFDEPLVNLDYKLREELRREMHTIFSERDVIAIYATTEPQEALMLGGTTVVMDAGKVLQTGPCLDVFRRPSSLRGAQVFSDPKINNVRGRIERDRLVIGDAIAVNLPSHLRQCDSGDYNFAVRAHHLGLAPLEDGDIALSATVELAEVSGSETFVHVRHPAFEWVVQEAGIFNHRLGEQISIYLNPDQLFAFSSDGNLVQAPH